MLWILAPNHNLSNSFLFRKLHFHCWVLWEQTFLKLGIILFVCFYFCCRWNCHIKKSMLTPMSWSSSCSRNFVVLDLSSTQFRLIFTYLINMCPHSSSGSHSLCMKQVFGTGIQTCRWKSASLRIWPCGGVLALAALLSFLLTPS